jgi:hypothetical protein
LGQGGAADPGNDPDSTDPDSTDPDAPDSPQTGVNAAPGVDPVALGMGVRAVVPRLTRTELSNALEDLLGDTSNAPTTFLAEDEYSPYDNDSARQTVSSSLVDSLQLLAEDVGARLAHDDAAQTRFMPCEPTGATDADCFAQVTQKLARLFLRRPISDEDVSAYASLLDYAEEKQDFYTAVELLLSALIQDPEFLYRIERGTDDGSATLTLTAEELATRMSILLWGSVPDQNLLELADNGGLSQASDRQATAQQMFADDRAKQQLYRFHAMWLGYRTLPHDATLNAEFQSETEHLIERVVFSEPSNYLDLFQSAETYLTPSLAQHYGLPAPSGDAGWVSYPEDSERAGILGQGSVLSAFAKFQDTSPTQRGILVRTRLLCLPVAPPPPTVNVDKAPGENTADCKVERYRAHREQSGCSDCHNQFEPIGMGLERYDRAGVYREHDDGKPDCAIDGKGTLPGYGDFTGPKELAALLVGSGTLDDCVVRQYLQFALSKTQLDDGDEVYAQSMIDDLATRDGHFDQWVYDLVASDAFAKRVRQEGQ